jgi:hypothetical protein
MHTYRFIMYLDVSALVCLCLVAVSSGANVAEVFTPQLSWSEEKSAEVGGIILVRNVCNASHIQLQNHDNMVSFTSPSVTELWFIDN